MDQDRADGYGVQRRAHAWVWPLEARRTDAGDIELLAPSLDRTQAFGTAGELLRRLAP